MTDYLALIVAKTRECPQCNGVTGWACDCKDDLGRVLDPRFDGLRWDYMSVQSYDDDDLEEGHFKHGDRVYVVNPDLAVLLASAANINDELMKEIAHMFEAMARRKMIHEPAMFLESAAKAVWEYLEQEEKVTTDA